MKQRFNLKLELLQVKHMHVHAERLSYMMMNARTLYAVGEFAREYKVLQGKIWQRVNSIINRKSSVI